MAESVTAEYVARVFEEVKNWGKWGNDDERGALNYITEKKRARRRLWFATACS